MAAWLPTHLVSTGRLGAHLASNSEKADTFFAGIHCDCPDRESLTGKPEALQRRGSEAMLQWERARCIS
jgi:hypothetical protein